MIEAGYLTYKHEFQWPSPDIIKTQNEKWKSKLALHMNHMYGAVDGMAFQTSKAPGRYSGKFKFSYLQTLIFVFFSGHIFHISPIANGFCDQREWNKLGLIFFLLFIFLFYNILLIVLYNRGYRNYFVNQQYGILGDAGFTFNPITEDLPFIPCLNVKKKPTHTHLTQEEHRKNRLISCWRVVVENTIGKLRLWKVLNSFYHYAPLRSKRTNRMDLNKVLTSLCALHNRKIVEKPLRKPSWECKTPINCNDYGAFEAIHTSLSCWYMN